MNKIQDQIYVFQHYVPDAAIPVLSKYFNYWKVNLVIVPRRNTKHGDFRMLSKGVHRISVNNSSNPYRFLITLIHEIAHLVAFKDFGYSIKPHGKEWKSCYQKLMIPFLNPKIFPKDLLNLLALHFKNPRASTDVDFNLVIELNKFDPETEKNYIFELDYGTIFETYNGRKFVLGSKRKKKYECDEVSTRRKYFFSPHAQVKRIQRNGQ